MNIIDLLITAVIIETVIIVGIIIFIWWQFSVNDSKLSKLIENRCKLEHLEELDDEDIEE
ncbi:MAG: hypothetical protein K2K48_00685 [Anaeroplasmataceae bacterium]|nr:hypothetical protein [Anaeroplasmataceae bacterium]MDE6413910.1 hypothetical protein [Anaeroplasmataceae bacterium]